MTSHRAFLPRCELFDSVIMRSIFWSAIFFAIFARHPGVSPNSISILTRSVGFPYIGLIVSVSVFLSRLMITSSPSFRLRDSRNSFGRTSRPRMSNLTIEFILHLLWELCGNVIRDPVYKYFPHPILKKVNN